MARRARGERGARRASSTRCSRAARRCGAQTGGYFDACATGALDPSGLVKGWAVDRAARAARRGRRRALVRRRRRRRAACAAGGWRIGIRHPAGAPRSPACSCVDDGAVATSGAYERGAARPRPAHRPRAATGVRSVTVLGPELATADAYATAAFAMGERGPAWTARLRGHAR